MATAQYNELTHSTVDTEVIDPMFHWDTHFPERYSRLVVTPETSPGRRHRRGRSRCDSRYRTQPITFDEIQEVDEEPEPAAIDSKEGLKSQFMAFSRSMDGLVPGFPFSKQTKALSDSRRKEVVPRVPDSGVVTTPTDEQTPERDDVPFGPGESTKCSSTGQSDGGVLIGALPISLQSRDADRRRRKHRRSQRRNKSIEDIPEAEKPEEDKEVG